MRRALAIACLCALSLAPASAAVEQSVGTLLHGGSYIIQRDTASPVTAIALWFRAPAAGYDSATPGLSRIAAAAAASAPLASGPSLAHFVRNLGGRFSINVFPDLVGIDALVPNSQARRVIAAMTAAYFSPRIDSASIKDADEDAAVARLTQSYSVADTLQSAIATTLFAQGPYHVGVLPPSSRTVRAIPLGAVRGYAQQAFRSTNAVLAIVGGVTSDVLLAVTDGDVASPGDSPLDSLVDPIQHSVTINTAVPGVGLGWGGPPISDERAATAMDFLANILFSSGPRGLQGQFVTLHSAGMFFATAIGTDPTPISNDFLQRVKALAVPMDPATFAKRHTAFLFRLRDQMQYPDEVADELGWYMSEGNGPYAPGDARANYWQAVISLTPAYVASIAAKYLATPVIVTAHHVPGTAP